MSKFESSSHESTLYSSSHVYSSLSWLFLLLLCSHDEDTFGYESKVLMYCRILVDDDLRSSNFLPRSDNLLFQISRASYPSILMLWGNSITHKYHHHYVLRPKTSEISLNSQTVKLDIGPDSYFPYLSLVLPLTLM